MTLIVDLQYFHAANLFFKLDHFSHCSFELYEHFQKMTFRNRCVVAAANGPVNLSIPVSGGRNQKTVLREVFIDYRERWQDNHWKTLQSAYSRSPYFEHFEEELRALYQRKYRLLWEWNLACFQWACDKLAINTTISFTTEYLESYPPDRYEDWRSRIVPTSINSVFGTGRTYNQVFEDRNGFLPNMSVLDYLFCNGPMRARS